MHHLSVNSHSQNLKNKFLQLNFFYIMLICCLAFIGTLTLYSAGNGNWYPWAWKHLCRFGLALVIMLGMAMVNMRFYYKYAYAFYFVVLLLLIAVEITGHIGMGAQRWIDVGFFKIQPSELMKIGLVLCLARYFDATTVQGIRSFRGLIIPAIMAFVPVLLIVLQPDLGTGLMLIFTAGIMLFAVGVQWWKFALGLATLGGLLPIIWNFLHDYQKERVLTFLNPERDPLGAGYHIIQSKIAFGSGGVFGKGFLNGTQPHLNFLPEKHTDFIFTMFSEEFGLIGSSLLLLLNLLIIVMGYAFAFRTNSYFAKLVVIGLNTNFFLYVSINTAMVMGLLPVVGIPFPLISYGGTVMISVMASFGIILCMNINRNNRDELDD